MRTGSATKLDLKAMSREEVVAFFRELDLPPYRAIQLLHWIHKRCISSIDEITEFSKPLRQRLSEIVFVSSTPVLDRRISQDGTEKFLLRLQDGETVETVLIPDDDRLTLCVSSQVGCAMACAFCLTGALGFKRDLRAHEIVDQITVVSRTVAPRRITNIVLMGMGEPLLNLHNVAEALWRMRDLIGISPRRITVSTSGIAPKITELAQRAPAVNLAISLNASIDAVRNRIMPINKRYPLRELIAACRRFPLTAQRLITFEYVLLKDVNDKDDDASRLVKLLRGIPSKVNLIPFNPHKGSAYARSDDTRILAFQRRLLDRNMTVNIRKSKGQDIQAACGQLTAGYKPSLDKHTALITK